MEVFERSDFPRTDDKLHALLSNWIWEKQQEETNDVLGIASSVGERCVLRRFAHPSESAISSLFKR